jgi:hypothetical protein
VGRGCGVGRGLGVGLDLGVEVGVIAGVGVGVAVFVPDSSALLRTTKPVPLPPATSTMPLGSKLAVCTPRAMLRLPVTVQVPSNGSHSSALVKGLNPSHPPATSTSPLVSSVAV